jgi:hypothetical protein
MLSNRPEASEARLTQNLAFPCPRPFSVSLLQRLVNEIQETVLKEVGGKTAQTALFLFHKIGTWGTLLPVWLSLFQCPDQPGYSGLVHSVPDLHPPLQSETD